MFAIPFTPSLPSGLGHQLLVRFWPQAASSAPGPSAMPPVPDLAGGDMEEDAMPDLAQRVREVGEW